VHFYALPTTESVGVLGSRKSRRAAPSFPQTSIDEACPVVVGSGRRFFPDGVLLDLELVEERSFRKSVVVLRYPVRG
jgi:hypothetical protein